MPPLFDFNTLAVIPSALGPLQALIAILPHLLVILTTALVAIFKPKSYRVLIHYFWTHKILTLVCFALVALLVLRRTIFVGKAARESSGASWHAFRGGPERTGAVAGARGPLENARVLWNYSNSSPGKIQAVDSSPTVVGNRVYFGTSIQTPFNKSGSIACLDADTGALAWQFIGAGMDRPLQPVFSSPAVGGGMSGFDKAPGNEEARYLVCGEGYHVEDDSRIFCLDLSRVRASGGKEPPAFKWSVQVTNHVESSPAIFENKVYAGTGDDGWWCIDLESGKVKWRLEGCAYYVITEGPQAEALAKLAGKTVAVNGRPKRIRPNKDDHDFSIMFLNASGFAEVAPGTTLVSEPAQSTRGAEMRTVIGKVIVAGSAINPEQQGSRVKIEMEKFYPDAECEPMALRIDGQARLFGGCGIDGQAVFCTDAESGKEIWRVKTRDPVFCAPTVVNGQVIVGLSNGTFAGSHANPSGGVLALSAADGSMLWEYKTGDGVLGAVAVKDDTAYACSLDGSLHVLNVKDGRLIKKFDTGAKLFCSPAVTAQGIYLSTNLGKIFGLKRESVSFQWSLNMTPGKNIFSSPCAAQDRLYIGSAESGVFCLGEVHANGGVRKAAAPWAGWGGNAEHSSVADERGAPAVNGNKSGRIPGNSMLAGSAIPGPIAACGGALYFAARDNGGKIVLACVDTAKRCDLWQCNIGEPLVAVAADETRVFALVGAAHSNGAASLLVIDSRTGKVVWERRDLPGVDQPFLCIAADQLIIKSSRTALYGIKLGNFSDNWQTEVGEITGAPVLKHGLLLLSVSAPASQLLCLDDSSRTQLWTADLPARPVGGPSVVGGKVFVTLAGKTGSDARIVCFGLTDGKTIWESAIDKAPVTPLACGGEHLAFTAADGTVIVLEMKKGGQSHTVPLGKGGQAPAIYQDTLFLAAENRVGAFDLATSSWSWGYREQKAIGRVWTAPILAGEALWVSTEKQGLIAVGGKDETK